MEREITWKGLRISLPSSWETVTINEALVLFPEECRQQVEQHAPCDAVGIAIVEGAPADLAAVVTKLTERRVKQGTADAATTLFAGQTALERIWFDGVSRVVSWFFVHRWAIYEVELTEPLIRLTASAHLADEARRLCATGIVFE